MSFFYDLNKKLDSIRATPEVTHKQLNERDEGKHNNATTGFKALADKAAKEYGSKAAGERVAGAVHAKMARSGKLEEEGMSRAAKGYEKYGKEGMEALARAGREGKALDPVRAKYDKYDNTEVDEGAHSQHAMELNPDFAKIGRKPGVMDRVAQGVKKAADFVAPGDEELLDRLQKSSGARRPSPAAREPNYMEAAKYRDPKYKDKLYTQEPPEADRDDSEDVYYNRVKPDDYQGAKRRMGGVGDEYERTDPLTKGFRYSAKNSINTHGKRKGLPSRDQISSLKSSIKAAHGTHAEPNLPEAGNPMTAKQKSFAALAPPTDKITFADKIAGAKKEVDEMLGDVAAEAMKKALGGGRGRDQEMDEASTGNAFDYKNFKQPEKQKATSFVHKGTYGTEYDGDKDDAKAIAAKKKAAAAAGQGQRGRGRPKNNASADTGEVMKPDFSAFEKNVKLKPFAGKITKHKMVGEDDLDPEDQGEYDQEGQMAKDTIKTVVRHAQALEKILGNNDNLPEWVQAKLAKIEGMMTAVDDYMQNQADDMDDEQEPIAEKAVSKKQQRFMGMVSAAKKGEKPASKEVAKVAKTMKKSDAEDFASTKHKGLPEKAAKKPKEKDVEESTTSGSVATSGAAPKAAKSSGGFTFGQGIYDSMNREVEGMIAESMSMNMSMNNDGNGPTRSLTVTATDEDATRLAQLLKSAGLGGDAGSQETCSVCGSTDCGCNTMDESYGDNAVSQNTPDYPTNTETAEDNFEYSGGLNNPKSTGQTTVPVIAGQGDRTDSYAESEQDALQRMMEMSGLREAKGKPDFLDLDKDGDKDEPMKKAANDKKTKVQEADTEFAESIQRMREIAGLDKKAVDEEKTEEGNLFTKGLEDDNIKIGDKIPGTNATKTKDIDESIFALTNQWRAYKG